MPARTNTTSGKTSRTAAKKPVKAAPVRTAAAHQRAKATSGHLSEDDRRHLIAEAAYFKAERRGFSEGSALEDWIEAEAEIDALLDARGAR